MTPLPAAHKSLLERPSAVPRLPPRGPHQPAQAGARPAQHAAGHPGVRPAATHPLKVMQTLCACCSGPDFGPAQSQQHPPSLVAKPMFFVTGPSSELIFFPHINVRNFGQISGQNGF